MVIFDNFLDEEYLNNYKERVQSNFDFLKSINDEGLAQQNVIHFNSGEGCLYPICKFNVSDPKIIESLSLWRRNNSTAFFTQFPVTFEGTARWLLNDVWERRDRILFLVVDESLNFVGHIGLANCINPNNEIEIDSVLKGVKTSRRSIMRNSLITLIEWSLKTIKPEGIYLEVFMDNTKAIKLYASVGFKIEKKIFLRKKVSKNKIEYISNKSSELRCDKTAYRMEFKISI